MILLVLVVSLKYPNHKDLGIVNNLILKEEKKNS
jgi:hypothetical protein